MLIDKCDQTKLVSKPNENNLKNVSTDAASSISTITKNKFISKVVNKSHKESIAKNISEGNIFIVYLSFSKKYGFHI